VRDATVSKNYAEALFELARRHGRLEEYGTALETVARLLDEDSRFRTFLETPRIDDGERKQVMRRVFGRILPVAVLNFLLVTIDKHRQRLLRSIAREYRLLLDEHFGREHVEVTLARKADPAVEKLLAERLSATLGTQAIPHFRVKPEILGGLVIRTRDTIYDGSIRRRLDGLRRRLLQAPLPRETLAEL
jgi:F-type H+-transporting ATPase subunit delta